MVKSVALNPVHRLKSRTVPGKTIWFSARLRRFGTRRDTRPLLTSIVMEAMLVFSGVVPIPPGSGGRNSSGFTCGCCCKKEQVELGFAI
jgi:hypothetical protein